MPDTFRPGRAYYPARGAGDMPVPLRHRVVLGVAALLATLAAAAQDPLPVLHARSRTVDVRDGDRLLEGVWVAEPNSTFDVYHAERSSGPKTVTFITDLEERSFAVEPGRTYDFVIELPDGRRCPTRISTEKQVARRAGAGGGPVAIPFTIVGGKMHLNGSVNGSRPLDLIFDTGADIEVLYPSAAKLGARLHFDGRATSTGTGGATERRTASDNRLEVGGLVWEHEPFLYIERQADDADGIVGYTAFVGKVVQIDWAGG